MSETPAHYNATVLDHFLNPRNVGEVPEPGGIGEAGKSGDGDTLRLSLRIKDGKIVQVRFKAFGCPAAIASASVATELIMGMTLAAARLFSNRKVVAALGGLPAGKMQCSVLVEEALRAALDDYEEKHPPTPLAGQTIH